MNSEDAKLFHHILSTIDEIEQLIQSVTAKLQQQTAETNRFMKEWKNE